MSSAPLTTGAPVDSQAASRRPLGCLIEIAETLVLTIVIFWLLQSFVAQPFRVEQHSMDVTLEEGQYVLVDKLSPHFDNYSRGDIVVLEPIGRPGSCAASGVPFSGEQDVPFIKRVIGEPGDTIVLVHGGVSINGVTIDEPYVHGADTQSMSGQSTWVVPADRLFVMGDNREQSDDSRNFGPICLRDVIGRAWLRYWPLDAIGILQTPTYPDAPSASPLPTAAPTP